MRHVIDVFWHFVEDEQLGTWEGDVDAVLARSAEEAAALGFSHLDTARRDFLFRLIHLVARVGTANLYSGYRNEITRAPTFEVAMMLHSYLIPVPDISRFSQPYMSGGVGWGYYCPRSAFADERGCADECARS